MGILSASLCMCMYIYICAYIYICLHVYTCIRMCVCIYLYRHIVRLYHLEDNRASVWGFVGLPSRRKCRTLPGASSWAPPEERTKKILRTHGNMRAGAYIYAYTNMCICVCMQVQIITFHTVLTELLQLHSYLLLPLTTMMLKTCPYTYIHTCLHAYIHTYMETYMHTYIQTYIHTYLLACMHTYTHTFSTVHSNTIL